MFLITINILLLIIGMILDIFAALVIMAPLIIPIALAFGVDFGNYWTGMIQVCSSICRTSWQWLERTA